VLTEENAKWDSYQLRNELSAEHEALKQGKSVHGDAKIKGAKKR